MTSPYLPEILVVQLLAERRAEADRERLANRARAPMTLTSHQASPSILGIRRISRRLLLLLIRVTHTLTRPAHTGESAAIDSG